MNVRNSKAIRLGAWCAICVTIVAVGAGAFLTTTFLQEGDTLRGGIAAAIAVAGTVIGGLLAYLCFFLAAMRRSETVVEAAALETASEPTEDLEQQADEPVAAIDSHIHTLSAAAEVISPAVTAAPERWAAPEFSDDEIPVFVSPVVDDELPTDMLVVPPALESIPSETPSGELPAPFRVEDDFDSRFDLPVAVDLGTGSDLAIGSDPLEPESSDDFESTAMMPAAPAKSALTPTKVFDVIDEDESLTLELPQANLEAADSTVVLQPTTPLPAAKEPISKVVEPIVVSPSKTPPRPAPVERSAPVERVAPVVAEARAQSLPKPAVTVVEEILPTASELPSMATTLTPTVAGGGLMPSEIPDFFLRMPTGRPAPMAKPALPVAPLPVKHSKPAPVAASAVRIIDSSTPKNVENELVTMTSIPDDWPS